MTRTVTTLCALVPFALGAAALSRSLPVGLTRTGDAEDAAGVCGGPAMIKRDGWLGIRWRPRAPSRINLYKFRLFPALLWLTLGCKQDRVAPSPMSVRELSLSERPSLVIDDKETYAVYAALLGDSSPGEADQHGKIIPIRDHTKVQGSCEELTTAKDPRLLAAGRDFAQQNSIERVLKPEGFQLGRKVRMIPSSALDDIFAGGPGGWKKFHEVYPGVGGFIQVSAVGFSTDKNFAVVYSSMSCGSLCGTGSFATLSKSGGVWRRNPRALCSWIS